jgi:shikimate kinase
MKIFLIGYMGCGKSRWGKQIADHYGFHFLDLDSFIEENEGKTIPEIFELYGESGFRQLEKKALQSISESKNIIISTGGGAPCFNNNMELMNKLGLTLYIEGSPELLRDRISNSDSERPLVKNLTRQELLEFIQRHLQTREPFYLQSKLKIISGSLDLQDFIILLDPYISPHKNLY